MRRLAKIVAVALSILMLGSLGALEAAYRITVFSLRPAPVVQSPQALTPRVTCAIWVFETRSGPARIPRLYPWAAYRLFSREPGVAMAWSVAREWLVDARRRGQVGNTLHWHLKGLAATAWVTRNMSAAQVVSRSADMLWAGGPTPGLEAGAHYWYGQPLAAVSTAQLAQLLVVAESPRAFDPRQHYDRVIERRNTVLEMLVPAGCMPASELAAAQAEPLTNRPI